MQRVSAPAPSSPSLSVLAVLEMRASQGCRCPGVCPARTTCAGVHYTALNTHVALLQSVAAVLEIGLTVFAPGRKHFAKKVPPVSR